MLPFRKGHLALVGHNVSVLISWRNRMYTEEMKGRIERFAIFLPEFFGLDDLHLLAREKLENAVELLGIKSPIDIRIIPRLQRRGLLCALLLCFDRVEKIERLAALKS